MNPTMRQRRCSPNFFRIMDQKYTLDPKKLVLPVKFVANYGEELGKVVTFNVADGKKWKIRVGRVDGRTWFAKGWLAFAAYYSIRYAYMLVFKYNGNSCFNVRVYGPHTAEIVYPTGGARIRTSVANDFEKIVEKAKRSEKRTIQAAMELSLKNPSLTLVMKQYNNTTLPVGHLPPVAVWMSIFSAQIAPT